MKKTNINFIIVEGIFSKEFSGTLFNKKYFFLELKTIKNDFPSGLVAKWGF